MNTTPTLSRHNWTALEFFAGIGLARAALESVGIDTIWANDYDIHKQNMYKGQWGGEEFILSDIHSLNSEDLPAADVAWSSSPCTDLSLAGKRVGLRGGRESSAFFGFTKLIREMGKNKPKVILLENVVGLATSHNKEDIKAAAIEFNSMGYAVDAITLDARRFIPQSRPRLFLVGALSPISGGDVNPTLRPHWLSWLHEDPEISTFFTPLPDVPDLLEEGLTDQIESLSDADPRWWDQKRVKLFVDSMSDTQKQRLDCFMKSSSYTARTAYRRTRQGKPVWEMRSGDISGCLRTARGGSSKQAVVVMGKNELKIRWMTGLEYARLMGAGWYALENMRDSQIQYGFGDAVAVPVAEWVAQHMIIPNIN